MQNPYYELQLKLGPSVMATKWTQMYLTDFLSDIGGLFTSLIAVASFILSNYQNFVSEKSLLKRLYGEDLSELPEEADSDGGKNDSLEP